jgi:two-component system, OmpR family, sensor histidine kinase CreC
MAVRDEQQATAQQRQVTLELALPARASLDGDAFLLHRALANLVRNAVDFAPAGSTVTLGIVPQHKRWQLMVRDRGPGLPDYAQGRVFERFYSLPRPDGGRKSTGLGLAFVREVAALHGGSASLANHPDGGALATLTLPRQPSFVERRP